MLGNLYTLLLWTTVNKFLAQLDQNYEFVTESDATRRNLSKHYKFLVSELRYLEVSGILQQYRKMRITRWYVEEYYPVDWPWPLNSQFAQCPWKRITNCQNHLLLVCSGTFLIASAMWNVLSNLLNTGGEGIELNRNSDQGYRWSVWITQVICGVR